MFRFENLDVWQKSVDFARSIYALIARFPDNERFGLVSQLRRGAVSVSSNVAEGSSRTSNSDFAGFVEIAYGSLMGVVSQLHVAIRQAFVDERSYQSLYEQADEISRMLSGLRSSLLETKT